MAFQMAAAIAQGIFQFLFALRTHNKNQYKVCARDTQTSNFNFDCVDYSVGKLKVFPLLGHRQWRKRQKADFERILKCQFTAALARLSEMKRRIAYTVSPRRYSLSIFPEICDSDKRKWCRVSPQNSSKYNALKLYV